MHAPEMTCTPHHARGDVRAHAHTVVLAPAQHAPVPSEALQTVIPAEMAGCLRVSCHMRWVARPSFSQCPLMSGSAPTRPILLPLSSRWSIFSCRPLGWRRQVLLGMLSGHLFAESCPWPCTQVHLDISAIGPDDEPLDELLTEINCQQLVDGIAARLTIGHRFACPLNCPFALVASAP